ncbi:MAG TPA: PaaI family thioesterase [Pyrinomonadaceae bacterium]|jgi:acyl-CoA thioesterase|nr:PaaI family thioesterase [Pyrinomonadaceae bacterium]
MTDEQTPALNTKDEQRLREIFKTIPYVKLIGIKLVGIERGSATLRLDLRDELMRNGGIAHGGVIASLIDTASAFAVMSGLEPGQTTTTIDLTIQYLRPLVKGQARAVARILRSGRRVAVVSVDVKDEREVLAATALTSYLVMS